MGEDGSATPTKGAPLKKNIALGAAALVGVAGGGAAVAATQGTSPEDERDAIVADVAKELGVAPGRVESAFRRALENRVDAAVAAGRLSEEEGAALKERIRSGELPRLGLRGPGRGHGHGHHGPGPKLAAAAAYLGVTEAELREALRDGDSLAEQARERGKSVDGLVDALVAAVTAELDRAVADGRLTDAQRDDRVAELEQHVSELVQREGPPPRRSGRHRRP